MVGDTVELGLADELLVVEGDFVEVEIIDSEGHDLWGAPPRN